MHFCPHRCKRFQLHFCTCCLVYVLRLQCRTSVRPFYFFTVYFFNSRVHCVFNSRRSNSGSSRYSIQTQPRYKMVALKNETTTLCRHVPALRIGCPVGKSLRQPAISSSKDTAMRWPWSLRKTIIPDLSLFNDTYSRTPRRNSCVAAQNLCTCDLESSRCLLTCRSLIWSIIWAYLTWFHNR